MIKTIDDAIEQFIEDLDFDVLVIWADTLGVKHDFNMWFDDDWPDKEDELRVNVGAALLAFFKPRSTESLAKQVREPR